jgi:Domain of unknown function (DUF4157)
MLWRLGKTVKPPAGVRECLRAFFGDAVDEVRIVEHSLFARLHGRAIATTRRRNIYLRGSAEDFFTDPVLMLHEYCHVLNQWEPGSLTTMRYVGECMRRGYWDNRFEVEAREFADDNVYRFRAMLTQHLAERRETPV